MLKIWYSSYDKSYFNPLYRLVCSMLWGWAIKKDQNMFTLGYCRTSWNHLEPFVSCLRTSCTLLYLLRTSWNLLYPSVSHLRTSYILLDPLGTFCILLYPVSETPKTSCILLYPVLESLGTSCNFAEPLGTSSYILIHCILSVPYLGPSCNVSWNLLYPSVTLQNLLEPPVISCIFYFEQTVISDWGYVCLVLKYIKLLLLDNILSMMMIPVSLSY